MRWNTAPLRLAVAAGVVAFGAPRLGAQATGTPPTPPAPPPPPATAPKVIVPASALPPSDSAVALCKDGSWVYAPRTAADCTQRGGLQVAMPLRAMAPAVAAAITRAALVAAPAKAAAAPPAGATAQCKDGTFLFGAPNADRCAGNGGVAAIFSRPTPAPTPPSRP